MAKCVPCKLTDLHSIPSTDIKKPKVTICFSHFSLEVLERGEPLRLIGQQVLPNQPSYISPGGPRPKAKECEDGAHVGQMETNSKPVLELVGPEI